MEAREEPAANRFDRFCLIALRAGLVCIAVFVVYFWMVRLGGDLNVDEAFNFRTYARSPLTAVGLYHEPNNHPLESLLKSTFFWGLGLRQPVFYRITGFLVVAGWLALGWAAYRRLSRQGSILVATSLVLMMLLTSAYNLRATRLRGYFLSSVLQLLYFVVLSRETGLLRSAQVGAAAQIEALWSRRQVIKYGLLSALLAFTVPSNIFALPAVWLLTVLAFPPASAGSAGVRIRRFVHLAVATGAFTVVLYAPIFLSLALGASRFHQLEPFEATGPLHAIRDDFASLLEHFAPRGVPPTIFGYAFGAFLVIALVTRRALLPTRIAAAVIATTLAMRLPVALLVGLPHRARTMFIPAVSYASLLLLHDLAAGWTRRTQVAASLALVALSFGAIPALVEEDRFYRDPSETTAFLQMLGGADATSALIVHDRMLDPIYPLQQVFGRERIINGPTELAERVSGVPADNLAAGSWKQRVRELIIPREQMPKLDLKSIRYLVVIDDVTQPRNPSTWMHPALDDLEARLSRRSVFQKYDLRFLVFQAP